MKRWALELFPGLDHRTGKCRAWLPRTHVPRFQSSNFQGPGESGHLLNDAPLPWDLGQEMAQDLLSCPNNLHGAD